MMIKADDIKIDDFSISLSKLVGKNIKDIICHLSKELGEDVTIVVYRLVFEDGTSMGFEGEHDLPYLTEYRTQKQPNFDDETLSNLYKEIEGEEDDELFE